MWLFCLNFRHFCFVYVCYNLFILGIYRFVHECYKREAEENSNKRERNNHINTENIQHNVSIRHTSATVVGPNTVKYEKYVNI